MSDEQLRMQAVVVDRATGPLQRIARQLQTVNNQRIDRLENQFTRVEHSARPAAREVMNAVSAFGMVPGVAGGVAVALSATALAMSNFAKSTVGLRDFSGSVRMSMQDVARFEGVAKRFNIDPDSARGGLKAFAHNLYEMRHRIGDLRQYLDAGLNSGKFSAELERLGRNGDIGKALEHALDLTEKVYKNDPVAGEKLSERLFRTPDFARIKDYVNERKKIGPIIARDVEAAEEFLQQQRKMAVEAERLKVNLGNALLPAVTELVKEINTIDFKPLVEDVRSFVREFRTFLSDINKLRSGDYSPITPKFDPRTLLKNHPALAPIQSGRNLLGKLAADPSETARQRRDRMASQIAELDAKMETAEPQSAGYSRMEAQREHFVRQLRDLNEALKRLEQQSDATAKKMSWTGGSGAPLLHNASLGDGGLPAAAQNFRMGGFRGGSMSIGGKGGGRPSLEEAARSPDSPVLNSPLIRRPDGGGKGFNAKAPWVMQNLMRDFNLTKEQAAGAVGNLGYESIGLQAINEKKPLIPGSRGGFGWAQWTGPRRRAFEAWAAKNGLDPKSDEANYGFLRHELQTNHRGTIDALKAQTTVAGSMRSFEQTYERAGIKNYGGRQKWSERALNAFELDEGRRIMDERATQRIEGTGKLTVDVKAPRGTNVNAQGGGIFQQVEIQRSMQMPKGEQGPLDPMPLGY